MNCDGRREYRKFVGVNLKLGNSECELNSSNKTIRERKQRESLAFAVYIELSE